MSEAQFSELQICLRSNGVGSTHQFASLIADAVKQKKFGGGLGIGLVGPLGAGKTEFVRGLFAALQIDRQATSPTYILENVVELGKSLRSQSGIHSIHHWDLYRLAQNADTGELAEQLADNGNLVLVEWPEKVPSVLPLLGMQIVFGFDEAGRPGANPNARSIRIDQLQLRLLVPLFEALIVVSGS